MLKVGISTSSFLDGQGKLKPYDGIGQLTQLLMANMEQCHPQLKMLPLHFSRMPSLKAFQEPAHFVLSYYAPFPLYRRYESQIDLLHVTDYRVPKIGVPVVNTVHDAFLMKYAPPSWKRRFANSLFKKGIDRSEKIIAVSHAAVPELTQYWGIDPKKVVVVRSARDTYFDERSSDQEIADCKRRFSLNKPYLLFVSTLKGYKNIDRLLDAYFALGSLTQEIDLVLVGKANRETQLNDRVKILDAKGKIKWLTYIDKPALRALYQGALGVTFPSLDEGFGFPIIEALASKVPLLTSNYGAMKEVSGGCAILVDPYEIDAISDGMKQLITDTAKRKELVRKGWDHVQTFSWERATAHTLEVYKQVAG